MTINLAEYFAGNFQPSWMLLIAYELTFNLAVFSTKLLLI